MVAPKAYKPWVHMWRVVHSWSLQGLINHEWSTSFADVELGCHRVKAPQKSQIPHSVLRTKACGLGSPKRTNNLWGVEQNPPPQILTLLHTLKIKLLDCIFFYSYVKFHVNRILFTIQSINLFFINNFILQKFEILIFDWWHSYWSLILWKFCKHERYTTKI